MRLQAFTEEQATELAEHLRGVLAEPELRAAVVQIDCRAAAWIARRPAGEERRLWKEDASRMRAIATSARSLACLLADAERRPYFIPAEFDWNGLVDQLNVTAQAAECDARTCDDLGGGSKRGRPADMPRVFLISAIFRAYPPGKAVKRAGSHFEQCVELVLGFLGRDVEDVHGLVVDALRRAMWPRPRPADALRRALGRMPRG